MLGLGNNLVGGTVLSGYTNTHSVSFDGTNDYIDTGASFQSTFRDSYSFSFWMKTASGAVLDNNAVLFGTLVSGSEDYIQLYNKAAKLTLLFEANNDPHREMTERMTRGGT